MSDSPDATSSANGGQDDPGAALERAKTTAGGASALAARLTRIAPAARITPQAVSQWRRAPAARVIAIEAATGISRHDLRPDLYPRTLLEASP